MIFNRLRALSILSVLAGLELPVRVAVSEKTGVDEVSEAVVPRELREQLVPGAGAHQLLVLDVVTAVKDCGADDLLLPTLPGKEDNLQVLRTLPLVNLNKATTYKSMVQTTV